MFWIFLRLRILRRLQFSPLRMFILDEVGHQIKYDHTETTLLLRPDSNEESPRKEWARVWPTPDISPISAQAPDMWLKEALLNIPVHNTTREESKEPSPQLNQALGMWPQLRISQPFPADTVSMELQSSICRDKSLSWCPGPNFWSRKSWA